MWAESTPNLHAIPLLWSFGVAVRSIVAVGLGSERSQFSVQHLDDY